MSSKSSKQTECEYQCECGWCEDSPVAIVEFPDGSGIAAACKDHKQNAVKTLNAEVIHHV